MKALPCPQLDISGPRSFGQPLVYPSPGNGNQHFWRKCVKYSLFFMDLTKDKEETCIFRSFLRYSIKHLKTDIKSKVIPE